MLGYCWQRETSSSIWSNKVEVVLFYSVNLLSLLCAVRKDSQDWTSNAFLMSRDSCNKEEDGEKRKHQDFVSVALAGGSVTHWPHKGSVGNRRKVLWYCLCQVQRWMGVQQGWLPSVRLRAFYPQPPGTLDNLCLIRLPLLGGLLPFTPPPGLKPIFCSIREHRTPHTHPVALLLKPSSKVQWHAAIIGENLRKLVNSLPKSKQTKPVTTN